MSALVQMKHQRYVVKACGRTCADMEPSTLPNVPLPPPVSLAKMLRTYPNMQLDPDWLADLDGSDTIH